MTAAVFVFERGRCVDFRITNDILVVVMTTEKQPIRGTTWFKLALLPVAATIIGLFFASQSYLAYLYRDGTGNFWASASVTLPSWYGWALLTPLIAWLASRVPIRPDAWLKGVVSHLALGVIVTAVKLVLVYQITQAIAWLPSRGITVQQFHPSYVTYWVILGLSFAATYYKEYRSRELRSVQLETRLAQAQLEMLKMQLHPHFLFNTLHAISTLMHKDVDAADRMMTQLSDLLRVALDNTGVQEVSLKNELDFLERYLEIEKTRFGDRLQVQMDIDPSTLDARVPNLILQPLVENAIRHGIERRTSPGCVDISARRNDGELVVLICDDGPGLKNDGHAELAPGVGLRNTKARLEHLYGENARLELTNGDSRGVMVKMSIPLVQEP